MGSAGVTHGQSRRPSVAAHFRGGRSQSLMHMPYIHMRKLRTDKEAQNLFITARELAKTIDRESKFETMRIYHNKLQPCGW